MYQKIDHVLHLLLPELVDNEMQEECDASAARLMDAADSSGMYSCIRAVRKGTCQGSGCPGVRGMPRIPWLRRVITYHKQ